MTTNVVTARRKGDPQRIALPRALGAQWLNVLRNCCVERSDRCGSLAGERFWAEGCFGGFALGRRPSPPRDLDGLTGGASPLSDVILLEVSVW